MKAGFYVYYHAPSKTNNSGVTFRLLAGPFVEWAEADKVGPRVVALIAKELPDDHAAPGASYGICRMEAPILPPGTRNSALWVSQAVLVP